MYIEIILIECELKLIETDLSAVLSNRNSGSLHMEGEGRKGISERGGGTGVIFKTTPMSLARLQEIRNLIIRCFLIRVQASFFVQIFIIIFFIVYLSCVFLVGVLLKISTTGTKCLLNNPSVCLPRFPREKLIYCQITSCLTTCWPC